MELKTCPMFVDGQECGLELRLVLGVPAFTPALADIGPRLFPHQK